jgi:hypothetical protein
MSAKEKGKRGMRKKVLLVVNVLLLVGLAEAAGFYFKKYNDLKKNPVTADQAAQAEVERYVAEVGRLYDLPKDEEPSVATVKDKEQLKDQPFFSKAENGDVTLIYTNAKLAILYRPSTKQLVNVSSVTVQDGARVKVIGLSDQRGNAIASLANAQISATDGGNAKGDHTGVIVVDLTGQNAAQAEKIADTLQGKVGKLPAGEDEPEDTDILVIIGAAQ